jgi:hypothetical protein
MSAASLLAPAAQNIQGTVQVFAITTTALLFLVVLELVRRRHLAERYALMWMIVTASLLVLSIWTDLLAWGTDLIGVEVPANGLFIGAIGVAFLLLLNFSVATSRLSEETKILAQEVARLDGELRSARANGAGPDSAGAEQQPHDPPVAGEKPAQ